jgi:hypothetical protein
MWFFIFFLTGNVRYGVPEIRSFHRELLVLKAWLTHKVLQKIIDKLEIPVFRLKLAAFIELFFLEKEQNLCFVLKTTKTLYSR